MILKVLKTESTQGSAFIDSKCISCPDEDEGMDNRKNEPKEKKNAFTNRIPSMFQAIYKLGARMGNLYLFIAIKHLIL